MNDETRGTVALCVAAVLVAAAVAVVLVFTTLLVQQTSRDHQREQRDYRVACVKTGKSLVRGDCIPFANATAK